MSDNAEKVPTMCSQRWILAYLFSCGFFFAISLRVNISVALICMVKTPMSNSSTLPGDSNLTSIDQCVEVQSQSVTVNKGAEFGWDKNTQSAILASFFYGYIVTKVPGGWLADRFGGRRVFGTAMAISAISTILLPVCARTSIYLVYILRVILGLASGVVVPSSYSMLGRWAPRLERTKLAAASGVGSVFGIIVTFSTAGILCEYGFDNGWGSIFYITGTLCCIWVVVWFIQVRDFPDEHPRITIQERDYIVNNIEFDTTKRTKRVPWKKMAKSLPLWATVICHMCGNWADYTLITSLPAFMKNVLKFDLKSNGVLYAIPYICSASMSMLSGYLADFFRRRQILNTTQTRKIFQSIAYSGAGLFLIATGFVPCEKRELAVVCLCFAILCTGISSGGYSANHIDLAPKYAGILVGITNTMATIPGMISPLVAGALTPNDTPTEWRNVFYVGAAFYAFGIVFFAIFASGDLQSWARDKTNDFEIPVDIKLLPSDIRTESDQVFVSRNVKTK